MIKIDPIFKSLLDVLLPNKCIFCGSPIKDRYYICIRCEGNLEYINGKTCRKCGAPIYKNHQLLKYKSVAEVAHGCFNCMGFEFSFKRNESLYIYSGIVKELIHMYKFEKRWRLYKYFSEELIKNKLQFIEKYEYIVAVPLTKSRLKSRGYNQSSLIAKNISKMTKIIYLDKALLRRGGSKPQSTTTSIEERYLNMNDEISINPRYLETIKGKNILLFDDILTTGITASTCASSLLYKGKVKSVDLLTIARTLR